MCVVGQVAAIRGALQKLRDDKAVALAPLLQSSADADTNAARLRARRQELVKEIEGIDDGLKKLLEKKQALQKEANEHEAAFKSRTAALEEQNRGLSALVARSEAVPALVESLVALRSNLTHEKFAVKVRLPHDMRCMTHDRVTRGKEERGRGSLSSTRCVKCSVASCSAVLPSLELCAVCDRVVRVLVCGAAPFYRQRPVWPTPLPPLLAPARRSPTPR